MGSASFGLWAVRGVVVLWTPCSPLSWWFFFWKIMYLVWKHNTFHMMASSNGNIFRVTGPLLGESIGHRPVTRRFDFLSDSPICTWTHGLSNNRGAGDLRHHRAQYHVTVMTQLLDTETSKVFECHFNYTLVWYNDTCYEWGIEWVQTRPCRVWNRFIPHS